MIYRLRNNEEIINGYTGIEMIIRILYDISLVSGKINDFKKENINVNRQKNIRKKFKDNN